MISESLERDLSNDVENFALMTPFESSLYKLSDIGSTEFKLWQLKESESLIKQGGCTCS